MIALTPYSSPPTDVAGYDPTRDAGDCRWDPAAAEHAAEFFPACLSHVQGFSGPFRLQPWQRDVIATMFGWRRKDGTRRYREALIAVPRKNGKSIICAGLGLYLLRCDGERGPQVYCAASTADQATMVFSPAAAMVRQHPILSGKLRVLDTTKRIVCEDNGGFLRAIPAEAAQAHGFNASAVLYDELHTAPNRELYDVLKTSQGARAKSASTAGRGGPLFVSITTAGFNRHSICWEVWDYARKVRDGVIADQQFLPVIYELAEGEDWQSEETWRRVNPNYDVSIGADFLREEAAKAAELPSYENTFRNLYLNEWTEQSVRWLSIDKWDVGNRPLDVTYGQDCWGGVDLSNKHDITAVVLAFRDGDEIALECRLFCPEDKARERSRRDRVPYEQWIREGYIIATPGSSIDFAYVRREINALAKQYHINQIAMDQWNAEQLAQELMDQDGFDVKYFPQNISRFTGPCKELERLVTEGLLRHGGHPVLRWMASNVAIHRDCNENIRPDKAKSTERIDGIVAACMAIGSLMLTPAQPSGSLFLY